MPTEAELADEYERGKRHGADDRRMIERRTQEVARENAALRSEVGRLKMACHRAIKIIEPNYMHQREKVADGVDILRQAIEHKE